MMMFVERNRQDKWMSQYIHIYPWPWVCFQFVKLTGHYLTDLVAAALAPGQLGDRDGDEDHEEAGGEILLVPLPLGGRGLLQRRQQVRVNLG